MARETPQTGEIYHVYNRGAHKANIFSDAIDIVRFLEGMKFFNTLEPTGGFYDHYKVSSMTLGSQTPQCVEFTLREHAHDTVCSGGFQQPEDALVRILSYALLPNHIHFLLEQLVDDGISEFMRRLSGGYTLYYNERNDTSGVLFQGTYKRKRIHSDEYLRYLIAYINCNEIVHDHTFTFALSESLRNLLSSKQQFIKRLPGVCNIDVLPDFAQDASFWREANVLAKTIRDNRDVARLLCE